MTQTHNPAELGARVHADDRAHVFHSWSAQAKINPVPIAGGEGSWFWDFEGNRYLDFSSQLINVNIGHAHPKVVEAIVAQARKLPTLQPAFSNEATATLARLIAERSPDPASKVFFTTGGQEANEHAIRIARRFTGRDKILAAYRSYHGAGGQTIGITGEQRRWANEPTGVNVGRFFGPYLYRSAFHATTAAEESQRALEHLRHVIEFEGPQTIAAVILEPVPGSPGVLVPPPGYVAGVAELCRKHGILFIADEVMVGFGRVGEWFASHGAFGAEPDLITFAKGVNSGYVPLGGVVIPDRVASYFDERPYPGGLTYAGHPLACAAGVASIELFEEEQLLPKAREVGESVLGSGLRALADKHGLVGEVRGRGFFWALELVADRATREPLAVEKVAEIVGAAKSRGVWVFAPANRIHVAPPLTASVEELQIGVAALDEALAAVAAG
ncbi:aminotransferase class-III [Segniliparus rotundus DSM 44985]|uniref:Aminotransferase class-III n=1 Tax=Segniliparus rotundus (strain ATCC BAA-972 / CDC 1076 / CIP 108378 / DSM 44985 / JCM 13578) TaxID=640132 RepID=D6Z7W5_SEGRD|nr:aspartate aminotransferase family protein [Segniliparus rotundus]ADG98045.1 aminotransferase class-III [Segniliparus rotundus DSM 44985]